MRKILIMSIVASNLFICGCKQVKNEKKYLSKVLDNLKQIESATYNSTVESWAPFDTVPSHVFHRFRREFHNPSDTTIGASYISMTKDKSKVELVYDGNMIAHVFHEHKSVLIDSFKTKRNLKFRPTTPPFFNYAKSILDYALNTNDSIVFYHKNYDSTFYVKLNIYEDNQVEFFGKAFYMPKNPYDYGDRTSHYELWIDKRTNLPFKVRREMSHNISVEICSNVEVNTLDAKKFRAFDYLPEHYVYREHGVDNIEKERSNLIGKRVAKWTLKDVKNYEVSLEELDSKVLMLQFTSVSCGPCRVSVPFLNKLSSSYDKKDFDFVAIECTAKSLRALEHYREKNAINYKFLQSSKEVMEEYSIKSFPVFYFLNENRKIVRIIKGYSEKETDKRIKSTINELI